MSHDITPQPAAIGTTEGAVGIVTLNRPGKRNAINAALLREVRTLLAKFDADPEKYLGAKKPEPGAAPPDRVRT